MSITIFASVEAKADAVTAVETALRAMLEPTRAEPGCLSYELFASRDAPGIFHLLETYTDDAALAAHHASAHFAGLVASIGDKLMREIRIERIAELEA
ncbi:putative quinol monooxygenase [Uliginosibacterium aquaticum]|uniref:Antibiotic biosynthesis monooxygenase n=1 Tax=Uliginosibacterium aquaticum TaxID=2731212 RepID=A0ABX2IKQ0_9RHOO|nr:antibiotic biosynthesis monooxygenase [Uliginosibacterium aquaticum]NSL54610.1 antibiotic biosynthesis monooxygenase [Uliginosibacterium aquaticum]